MRKHFYWFILVGIVLILVNWTVAYSSFQNREGKARSKAESIRLDGVTIQKAQPILTPRGDKPSSPFFQPETLQCDNGTNVACWFNGDPMWNEAVRLTPSGPCTLNVLGFWPCDDVDQPNLTWGVWDDDGPGGFPMTLIDSGTVTPPYLNDWFWFTLPTPIFIDSGDIYIGWLDINGSPFYANTIDDTLDNCNYWDSSGTGTWVLDDFFPGDFLVRGVCEPTAIGAEEESKFEVGGGRASLLGNHPNPFHQTTTIRYLLPRGFSPINLGIYDLVGREVRSLVNRVQEPGEKSIVWNGRDGMGFPLPSGIYFYRLTAGDFTSYKKMILLR